MTTTAAFVIAGVGLSVAVALSVLATRRVAQRKRRALAERDRVAYERDRAAYEREEERREELLEELRERIVGEEALDQWETVSYETVSQLIKAHRALLFDAVYRRAAEQQRDLFADYEGSASTTLMRDEGVGPGHLAERSRDWSDLIPDRNT